MRYPDWDELDDLDETQYRLSDVLPMEGTTLRFGYDFGDGWEHDVEAIHPVASSQTYPACIAGQRACPPDDCGGPWGYQEIFHILADPNHPDPNEVRAWVDVDFDSELFRVAEANTRMREPQPPMFA